MIKRCCPFRPLAGVIVSILLSFSSAGTVVQAAGTFVIEAEDFNHGGGQHLPVASAMPYYGGAYDGLSAVDNVDYHRDNDTSSDYYRQGEVPDVPMDSNAGFFDRGEWVVTTSYKLGWINEGYWFNYTRSFPPGQYQVYAALSYGDTGADLLRGTLAEVAHGATTTSQTLSALGIFNAPGTGGWGSNALVPLQNGQGENVLLDLDGTTTLRFTTGSGDFDYLLFEAIAPPQISDEPEDLVVEEGQSASFSLSLAIASAATYQWYLADGSTSISGATSATYTIHKTTMADNHAQFFCRVTNPQGSVDSRTATLTVSPDSTRPVLSGAGTLGDNTTVIVTYSEPVEVATGTNPGNYDLDQGASVLAARSGGDSRTVILTTTSLNTGSTYVLTVSNVRDQASVPNTILPDSQASFSFDFSPLDVATIKGAREPLGPSARTTGFVISEIMYNPAPRLDGRNLEFVELFNSEETPRDLSGYRLSGEIDYTFPQGTSLASKGFLVVAPNPADVEAEYGISGVMGGFTNSLANAGGVLRLRNAANAVLLEIEYSDDPPWPVAADNSGHSLVLARPSFGENNPQAWAQSDIKGGSPGTGETAADHAYRRILINEFLAHTDDPQLDYVELYNYGTQPIDISGCVLTDDSSTNKFVIPNGTTLAAKGFAAFNQVELGFALDAGGETIYLIDPLGTRVIDSIEFEPQANGVAYGRFPDGAPLFHELQSSTFGAPNSPLLLREVVINELMYNPISGDSDDEFVELYNKGDTPVSLAGYRLGGAVKYTFASGVLLAPNSYLVVAHDQDRLLTNYPGLSTNLVLGNYSGTLANGGERLMLTMPDDLVSTNNNVVVTNLIHIVVDEVVYRDGGQWGRWSDGDGSSLELKDAHSDNRLASNWADSDESAKSEWTTISHTGVLDNGRGLINELHVMLLGGGECLVDNLEVREGAGANVVPNGDFESGTDNWVIQGNHVNSAWSEPGLGDASNRSLYLRATSGGDNGANRVETDLTTTLTENGAATLTGRARWLRGHPDLLLRLHGNHLEALGTLNVPTNLGTPGAPNSCRVDNTGPAIMQVAHSPVLPGANQAVTVTALVQDIDGLAGLTLDFRVDPSTNLFSVPMSYRGAGFYSATIIGQPAGTLVSFAIRAADNAAIPAIAQFPDLQNPTACLIRFGDPTPAGDFGVYRLWLTEESLNTWSSREKMSNEPLIGTFIYGDYRAVYGAGGRYRGSPFIRPGYNTPNGNRCAYVWTLPPDDCILGADELNLDSLEPDARDSTALRETTSFWMAEQLGLPFSHQRFVHVVVNGVMNSQRNIPIYADTQQPDGSYMESWFRSDPEGEIFKIDDWFEFDDAVAREFNENAQLLVYTTSGGEKKKARYRWSWEKKSNGGLDDDYSSLFNLVDALNAPDASYVDQVEQVIDAEEWISVFALRHAVGDWDGYGYDRGKNQFVYKPENDKWQMLLWDLDFSLGCSGGHSPTQNLWDVNDPTIRRLYNNQHFRRAYYRALSRVASGPLQQANYYPLLNARYQAFQANSVNTVSPFVNSGAQDIPVPDWINQRRDFILTELATVSVGFAITINNGNDFSSGQSYLSLTGTAPVEVKTIKINGVSYPITWSNLTTWSLNLALAGGANNLSVEGFDVDGNPIGGLTDSITVTYTGTPDLPEDHLMITEIMYNPTTADAAFIELHNTSTTTAFNLSNYRLDGAGFAFSEGTLILPGEYLVVVNDYDAFRATYGSSPRVAGTINGSLDNGGETLRLLEPGILPDEWILIDDVTYDDDAPWPPLADGFGPSLQLIDGSQDNNRVGNWEAIAGSGGSGTETLITMTDTWKYEQSGTDLGTAWREESFNDTSWPSGAALLYVEESALPAAKNTLLTYTNPQQMTYYFRKQFNFSGNPATTTLEIETIIDDGAVVYLNGTELLRNNISAGTIDYSTPAASGRGEAYLEGPFSVSSTPLKDGVNVIAVEVHQVNQTSSDIVFGLSLQATTTDGTPYTPGAPNATGGTLDPLPLLWLNEVQPNNVTGAQDQFGDRDAWVEVHNSGATSVDLTGYYLSPDSTNLLAWPFPAGTSIAPAEFMVVWLDNEPGETGNDEFHADFTIPAQSGMVVLTRSADNTAVDYLRYSIVNNDRSYGAYPDGTPAKRQVFYTPTPGAANDASYPPVTVTINEWMAANSATVVDPADGDFDDWFELYNDGTSTVDLSGFTLTDDLSDPTQWPIPEGTTLAPGAYLLIWADSETGQNDPANERYHANFKLSGLGETLGLFAPNGSPIDQLSFGIQTNNISEGRWPDGNSSFYFMTQPTPDQSNTLETSVNQSPTVDSPGNRTVDEGALLTFPVAATDMDTSQSLTFVLEAGAPAGAYINPASGVFTWTPTEPQGPQTYSLTVTVADNGVPPLSDSATFSITVSEINQGPQLDPVGNRSIAEGEILTFAVLGSDSDVPTQSLTYSLGVNAPAGASIDPNSGMFSWRPSEVHGGVAHPITILVSDDGSPSLSASETIIVDVAERNLPPVLDSIADRSVAEGQAISFGVNARDDDIPTQTLTYSVASGLPENAVFNSGTGQFSWTPSEVQGPSTNTVVFRVVDNGIPGPLEDTETVVVTVTEVNQAPVLAAMANRTIAEAETLTFTISATDPDQPANGLIYALTGTVPSGASLSTDGIFTWTPDETQGDLSETFQVQVTDDGSPARSDSASFDVTVTEVNEAPVLEPIPSFTVQQGSTLSFTIQATDQDSPVNGLSYALGADAPVGATINALAGAVSWLIPTDFSPGSLSFTVQVTDNGYPSMNDTATVNVQVTATQPVILTVTSILGDQVTLTWDSSVGHTYRIQWAGSLTAPLVWNNAGDHPGEGGTTSVVLDAQTSSIRFYRIQQLN